jgi:hypothetical protein
MHKARWIAGGVAVVLVGSGAFVWWRWQQRGPSHPSVNAAIDRYRTSVSTPSDTTTWAPKPGVYVYSGSGSETLSFLGTHQSQGPRLPGTITRMGTGCWQFRIDYNSYHQQTWTRCGVKGALNEAGNAVDQKFDFLAFSSTEHSVVQCTPPVTLVALDRPAGTSVPVRCTSRSKTTGASADQSGKVTFLGRTSVNVGGRSVPALHARESFRVSGGQTGTVSLDLWFAVADALPLAETHSIRVVSPAPAPINHVTYTERGRWQLTSLAPQR